MPLNTELPSKTLTAIAFVSFAAVGAALLGQHLLGMLPCAWCIFQRLLFVLICIVATLGAALGARVAHRISLILVMLVSLLGMATAWHQWTVASQSMSCDQTLADRLVAGSGLDAAMPWLFGIYANCMDAAVSILGLDFAVWSLMLFAAFTITSVFALRSSKQT